MTAPAGLPTVELRRRLGRVNEAFLGLNDFLILTAWATQPDPTRACQILGQMLDQIEELTDRLEILRQHVDRLWDLSFNEEQRRGR